MLNDRNNINRYSIVKTMGYMSWNREKNTNDYSEWNIIKPHMILGVAKMSKEFKVTHGFIHGIRKCRDILTVLTV